MPQVFVILAPGAREKVRDALPRLDEAVTKVVKNAFERRVSFTAIEAVYVHDDAEVQFEIRFSTSEKFDPSLEEKNAVILAIEAVVESILASCGVKDFSVWLKPAPGGRSDLYDLARGH